MATIIELRELVARLNAELLESGDDARSCITISMPRTSRQEKDGIGNDFIATSCDESLQDNIDAAFKFAIEWEEFWNLKSRITKKMIKEYVRDRLGRDDRMAQKAVVKIFEFQTIDEQNAERTSYSNNVGFSGHDAPFLSSLAKQIIERTNRDPNRKSGIYLSKPQLISLKKLIKKYWKQLVNIMVVERDSELKLLKLVAKANPTIQLRLNL